MGFDAGWQLAGWVRSGMRGSGFPKGWLSEKKPCPLCGKPVAGRHEGMAGHIAAKHSVPKSEALSLARTTSTHPTPTQEPAK